MQSAYPTEEQLSAVAGDNLDEPVAMVNLLKFKGKATYEADAPEAAEDLSGAEAYMRYGAGVYPILKKIGAKPLFSGPASRYVIGGGEAWDAAAVVWYPSRKVFLEMGQSAEYQAVHYHRAAGLEHQQLIETTPGEL